MTQKNVVDISEILTRGTDVLAKTPEFKLVGRDKELEELSTVLMQKRKHNLIVTGRGGVGMSSIVLGIQASKSNFNTPVEIVGKRLYWLNTDKLFETGNTGTINSLFGKIRQTLTITNNSVLIVEDTIDFLKAAQNNGCTNLVNCLMGDIKLGKYQAIMETKDDNLGEILKCDGDMLECCTLYEIKEPSATNLRLIATEAAKGLEVHHNVKVSEKAIETAAMVTSKYQLAELRAQPDAAIMLLDRALTDFCRQAHSQDNKGNDEAWKARQADIRRLYKDMSTGEEDIRKLEDAIEQIQSSHAEKIESLTKTGGENLLGFAGSFDTPEIIAIREKIKVLEELVKEATDEYKAKVSGIYEGLTIGEGEVLKSFSALSGIPVDKLNEDERVKLKSLDQILASRVIGQTEPTNEVAKAVKRSRLGLKMPNKPSGTFMFLGPSGVGKTELAKALAESLAVPLLRFDMSEYMEKHALAKLIGAPPGYEGYEAGGILTNQVRRNPYSVILFDEIEKAHPDVFNLMLQVLDDARLTDSRGLTASFKDAIIIMTTNIGTVHFLNESLTFEEAKELALTDLREQYRPEFLGRFGGNIYCFQRLSPTVLRDIARKDITRINGLIKDRGIHVDMTDEELSQMIEVKYNPREGARSILGYIDRNITSGIADVVLNEAVEVKGGITCTYEENTDRILLKAA